ncbi:AAA family ATPase [Paenibacillus sp. N4]|uniref:3'-5' exonuclease n=1 Tax=Paenibacillus vietnamensis TaxID=2590547 RepID=UPI001CD13D9C|nr:3'-5' exonuclease [Paenibacillus vietnamensis]MCA0757638.1 AAA family ATPase [Paenibacillus vietnamensis]
MAYMVPEAIRTSAAAGERLLYRALKEHLPSDYVVYFEPEIDGERPSFVIIGPDLGLVVLEVLDYTRSALIEAGREEWQVYTAAGQLEAVMNPYRQARASVRHVADRLKRDERLTLAKGKLQGQLKFPHGFGTVFPRMKRKDFREADLYEVIPEAFVLCRDEIDPEEDGFSADALIERIHGMFESWRRTRYILTKEDISAVRSHLVPEVRLSTEFRRPAGGQEQLVLSMQPVKELDLHQETIAKQLGDRHRLIRGVAGSGKTLVLATRANMLAKHYPDWRILVLCSSIPLSQSLKQTIGRMMDEPEDLLDWIRLAEQKEGKPLKNNVEVYNFHEWLRKALNARDTDIPMLIGKLERKEAILPAYEAILIDEGQDFQPGWLKLLSLLLNPSTQNLLLVEDRAQSYMKRKSSLLKETGLDFRGRSRVLSVNYRNTAQIARFAWDFYRKHSLMQGRVLYGSVKGMEIIPPQSAKRNGPEPSVLRCGSFQEELRGVIRQIEYLHNEHKVPFSDMAILYRVKDNYHSSFADGIRRALNAQGLPFQWLTEESGTAQNELTSIGALNVSEIEGAKGLDFRAVFIVNAENMPFSLEEVEEREVSLFYVAMTRALEWLHISYSGDSRYTLYLDEVRQEQAEPQRTDKLLG